MTLFNSVLNAAGHYSRLILLLRDIDPIADKHFVYRQTSLSLHVQKLLVDKAALSLGTGGCLIEGRACRRQIGEREHTPDINPIVQSRKVHTKAE